MSQQFKSVVFDLHGVIIGNTTAPSFAFVLRDVLKISPHKLEIIQKYQPALEKGQMPLAEFREKVGNELGEDFDQKDELDWEFDYLRDYPVDSRILDLADRLQANHYKTAILSNISPQFIEKNRKRGIYEHFDTVLLSPEIAAMKPEPLAYEILLDRLGDKASEVIFVDDLQVNVDAARAIGIRAIQFTGYETLIDELEALGVLASK